MPPDLSIIVPVYNRGDLTRHTLGSVQRASAGLNVEVIIVDDGSEPPVADALARLGYKPAHLLRQPNQGLLFARLAGFRAATGRYTLFLDSDDLVSPEKFRAQLTAMDASSADVSYTDSAQCVLSDDPVATPDTLALDTADSAEFFLVVQPPPHSPIFRTAYLRPIVADAFFPPSPLYNPVAEIWFYHNAAPHPAKVVKVPGPHTIVGLHPGVRLTNHWERLCVASLATMEAFARTCPTNTPTARRARQLVGEIAFRSWRRLPRNFSPEIGARHLGVWRRLSPSPAPALGGGGFRLLSAAVGPELAARLLRRLRGGTYESCRTLSDGELARLLGQVPPP